MGPFEKRQKLGYARDITGSFEASGLTLAAWHLLFPYRFVQVKEKKAGYRGAAFWRA
jgi:hypothetical protein